MDSSFDYTTLSMLGNQVQIMDYEIYNNNNNNTMEHSYPAYDNLNLSSAPSSFLAPALTEYSPSFEYMFDVSNDISASVTPDLAPLPHFPKFHNRPRGFSYNSGVSFIPGLESSMISTKIIPSNVQLDLVPVESRRHSIATTKSFTCPHCTKSFDRKFVLKRHMGSHRPNRPYKCEPCSMSFYRKDIFDRHAATKKCVRAHLAKSQSSSPHNED